MSVKKRTKRKALKADIVYDDETSSSSGSESENLEAFRKNYLSQDNTDSKCSSDADDESNENSSVDVSTGEEDGEYKGFGQFETPTEKQQITFGTTNACINPKVDKLRSQLRSLKKVSSKCTEGEKGNLVDDHSTKLHISVGSENMVSDVEMTVQEMGAESPTKKLRLSGKKENYKEVQGKSSESYEDEERLAIRAELSTMSMEEILQLKETLGSKIYNRAMGANKIRSGTALSPSNQDKKKHQKGQDLKRENKNRPREMSSKKTIKRYRDVVGLTAEQNVEKRDPRFDNLCGEFDKKVFDDGYKFVDGIKAKELKLLKEQLLNEDDPSRIKQVKYLIQRMENQDREKKKTENEKQARHEERKRNRQLLKDGKSPEFVSKQERQNKDLIEKYEELKKSNKLESYMKKKNKKNLSKERKKLKAVNVP